MRICRINLDAAKRGIKVGQGGLDERTFRSPVQMRGSWDVESRARPSDRLTIQ
jgi:hypothetical protein